MYFILVFSNGTDLQAALFTNDATLSQSPIKFHVSETFTSNH